MKRRLMVLFWRQQRHIVELKQENERLRVLARGLWDELRARGDRP